MAHSLAEATLTSLKTWERKPADYYPTPPDVTHALLDFLQLPKGQNMWEPACGDGAMAKVLEARGHMVAATDLREDSGWGRGGVDFLTSSSNEKLAYDGWIITNPPFNVAAAFIQKSLSHTPNVAMLLKAQFWHAKSREGLFRDNPPAWVLPLTWRPAFLEKERGSSPLMDVIWTVWQRGISETRYRPLLRPIGNLTPRKSLDLKNETATVREHNENIHATDTGVDEDLLIDLFGVEPDEDLLV